MTTVKRLCPCLAWSVIVLIGTAAQGTMWMTDFSTMVGTNEAVETSYTDTDGLNPHLWDVYVGAAPDDTDPWLSKNLDPLAVGGATALFYNAPGGNSASMRHQTNVSSSIKLDEGISVSYRMRMGAHPLNRGPIQVQASRDGSNGTAWKPYIRLRTQTSESWMGGRSYDFVDILNNSGLSYHYSYVGDVRNIRGGALAPNEDLLPDGPEMNLWDEEAVNLTDEWAQWTVFGKFNPNDTTGGYAWTYWKVWLNGHLLQWYGPSGGRNISWGDEDWSFRTANDGTGAGRLALGELSGNTEWDFEFDFVNYRDDGYRGYWVAEPETGFCFIQVSPLGDHAASADRGQPAQPGGFTYEVTNFGTDATGYTVEETDADGNPMTYPWLILNKTGDPQLPAGSTDTVVASIVDTDLPGGTHTAYITFTDDCDPPQKTTRRIDLEITECLILVDPDPGVYRSVAQPGATVDPVVFTVTNAGVVPVNYTVQTVDICPWLDLDKSGGSLAAQEDTDQVTATPDPTGLPEGQHRCTLRFTDNCSPAVQHDLEVVLSVLSPSSVHEQFDADFVDFSWMDADSESPFDRCDSQPPTGNIFYVDFIQGNLLNSTGWLTQGSIDGVLTTAKFYNPPGSTTAGRARFLGVLPFDASYDPAKGLLVAWRMRVGDYAPGRGPIHIMAPTVPGPYEWEVPCYNAYIRLQNGTHIRILDNGGNVYSAIDEMVLDTSIADEYHQWTAAVSYDSNFAQNAAYWRLWLDGKLLLFGGMDGSVSGPQGEIYSFRTVGTGGEVVKDVLPSVRMGELNSSTFTGGMDFEFDFVRVLSLNVTGSPFWDGNECVPEPAPSCNVPWADADGDNDVDMDDFAVLQRCYSPTMPYPTELEYCRCFDHDNDGHVDGSDVFKFVQCGTGPAVPWVPTPECP